MNLISLTKKAWQIRRAAAAQFGVRIMTISWKLCLQMAGEKPMSKKEQAIATLTAQVEALRTMPEGSLLGDGTSRVMIERRRARYIAEGEACLAALAAMEDRDIPTGNLLFHDAFLLA